jgi:VWFA-related protein
VSSTNLVIEAVILKDKRGNPIEGLTAKDFTITEDGKPQKVSFCEFQKLEDVADVRSDSAPPAALQQRPPETKEVPVESVTAVQIAPEKPGDLKFKDRRLIVMFFDMASMPIADQIRAQTGALKYLRTEMTNSDLVAIMTYSTAIKVVEDFTDDRDFLERDIKKLVIGEGQGFETTIADDTPRIAARRFNRTIPSSTSLTPNRQLSALESAAKMLASLHEEKALVYFSSGV